MAFNGKVLFDKEISGELTGDIKLRLGKHLE